MTLRRVDSFEPIIEREFANNSSDCNNSQTRFNCGRDIWLMITRWTEAHGLKIQGGRSRIVGKGSAWWVKHLRGSTLFVYYSIFINKFSEHFLVDLGSCFIPLTPCVHLGLGGRSKNSKNIICNENENILKDLFAGLNEHLPMLLCINVDNEGISLTPFKPKWRLSFFP